MWLVESPCICDLEWFQHYMWQLVYFLVVPTWFGTSYMCTWFFFLLMCCSIHVIILKCSKDQNWYRRNQHKTLLTQYYSHLFLMTLLIYTLMLLTTLDVPKRWIIRWVLESYEIPWKEQPVILNLVQGLDGTTLCCFEALWFLVEGLEDHWYMTNLGNKYNQSWILVQHHTNYWIYNNFFPHKCFFLEISNLWLGYMSWAGSHTWTILRKVRLASLSVEACFNSRCRF